MPDLDDFMPWLIGAFILAVVAGVGVLIYYTVQEEKAWKIYKVEHHCKDVGVKKGQVGVGTGVTSSGKVATVTTVSPDQTIWDCDGYTVIR